MSKLWEVRVRGTVNGRAEAMTILIPENDRDDARREAMRAASRDYGLETPQVTKIFSRGQAYTCTFAESARGAARRAERKFKQREKQNAVS